MSSITRLTRPLTALAGGVAFVLAGPALPASAHIHPDPGEIPTGTPSNVSFTIEHGCEGSPTVKVELKIPAGFTDVSAAPIDGWSPTIAEGIVTWEGGPLDAETEGSFAVTLTATMPGDFEMPIVQTCEVGNLAWIEAEIEGQPEPEHPAPVLTVTGEPVVTIEAVETTVDAATTVPTDTSAAEPTTADATTAAETTVPGSETTAHQMDDTTPVLIAPAPAPDADDDGGSNTGPVVGGVVAAIVVLGGGGYALTRKRRSAAPH